MVGLILSVKRAVCSRRYPRTQRLEFSFGICPQIESLRCYEWINRDRKPLFREGLENFRQVAYCLQLARGVARTKTD